MSSNIVDQITLECLMNKDLYHKLVSNKKIVQDKNKDKKFYKKRIIALTKELFNNEKMDNLMQDVNFAFENYVKTCIRHFKITDESDIIQQDYAGLEGASGLDESPSFTNESSKELGEPNKSHDLNDLKEENKSNEKADNEDGPNEVMKENNTLLLRQFRVPSSTLDNFVKGTMVKSKDHVLPKQKDINLETDELMNKGICKKKNIDNKYA